MCIIYINKTELSIVHIVINNLCCTMTYCYLYYYYLYFVPRHCVMKYAGEFISNQYSFVYWENTTVCEFYVINICFYSKCYLQKIQITGCSNFFYHHWQYGFIQYGDKCPCGLCSEIIVSRTSSIDVKILYVNKNN